MDPLHYFDEEYAQFLNHVDSVSALLTSSQEVVQQIAAVKQAYLKVLSGKTDLENIDLLLNALNVTISTTQDLLKVTKALRLSVTEGVVY